jgi:hypothetical protein
MKSLKQLLIVGICLSSTTTYSQQFANTTWQLYSGNTVALYYKFNANTMSYSTNNINYTAGSTYQETGSTLNITDILTSVCGTSTGSYSFTILSNVATFTEIFEICGQRRVEMNNYNWIKLIATGISSELGNREDLEPIYPNPSNGIFKVPYKKDHHGVQFSILNQVGQTVFRDELTVPQQSIDLTNYPKGVYYFKTDNEKIKTQRIVLL